MSSTLRCFTHPGYVFPLPEEHPFPMDKFWRSAAMLRESGNANLQLEEPLPATETQLLRVHTAEYLASIRRGDLAKPDAVRLGLPACAALLERAALEVGGTLAATAAAWSDGLACNLAGGTHHAFADRGLGYCVLNDVAIAIRDLHDRDPSLRILVIDTDAHQGNGTHGIFAGDERVFTYSIHVGKNYPAIKTPGCLDVPLDRYVEGDGYLAQLAATLPAACAAFAPDFAFWIAGADPHVNDRFGQMRLTDEHFAVRDQQVLDLVTAHGIPTAVLYGGGYNRDRVHTARLHADTVLRVAAAKKKPGSTSPASNESSL